MIDVGASFDLKRFTTGLQSQIDSVLNNVLKVDVPNALKRAQAQGFPTDPNQYTLILRNRGKETRRQLKTIQAKFLRVGTQRSPLSFTFSDSSQVDIDLLAKAARIAWERAVNRAPIRSGTYRNALDIYLGDLQSRRLLTRRLSDDYRSGESVFIMSPVAYASVIEHGFYKKFYETQRLTGGILLNVTRAIRRIYGGQLAIRLIYVSGDRAGKGNGYGTFPAIEIGPKGSFAAVDTLPGTNKRRRRRGR